MELLIHFHLNQEKIDHLESLKDWSSIETRGASRDLALNANAFIDFFNQHVGLGEIIMSKKPDAGETFFCLKVDLIKEMISLVKQVTDTYQEVVTEFLKVYYLIEVNHFTISNLKSISDSIQLKDHLQALKERGFIKDGLKEELFAKFEKTRFNTQSLIANINASIYLLGKLGQI